MASRPEPRLSDVAERAGVSLATVSRVLNNRGYLSDQTKQKVAKAIGELGYRPNQVARSLLGQRTHMVGLIVPTVALPFFGELATETENALAEHGYRLLLCNSFGRADREREYLDLLAGNRVDGIISGAHNDPLDDYATLRLPLVTIDRELAPNIPNVRAANEQGGRLATELLLRRGATRPVLLTSRSHARNLRERGYREVLAEAGIAPQVLTVDFHTPEPERSRAIWDGLDGTENFDAIFATDDLMAATALDWAKLNDRQVPAEIQVIGFDGTMALRRALPQLSTVQQPIAQLAQRAVELLIAQIEGNQELTEQPVAPVELAVNLIEATTTRSR